MSPPPPILKTLPKIFAHSDKTVRAEGTALTLIMAQYMGWPGMEPWLADLKPVQVKELKEGFDALDGDGKGKGYLKPTRLTRAHAREVEAGGGEDASPEEAEQEPEGVWFALVFLLTVADFPYQVFDPNAFVDPVDITPKLPSGFHNNIKSSKWKERKEALDELATLLSSTPKIVDVTEIGEIARALALCVQKDANVSCVMTASNCMEHLAKGLMGSFGRYRESVIPPMLDRMKERKATVTDTIGAALDAVFLSVSSHLRFEDEDLIHCLDNTSRCSVRSIGWSWEQEPAGQRRNPQIPLTMYLFNESPYPARPDQGLIHDSRRSS